MDKDEVAERRARATEGDAAAIAEFEHLAAAGDGDAAYFLALLTASGIGAAQDLKGSLQRLQQAAERGHRQAQADLAALVGNWRLAKELAAGKEPRSDTWGRLRDAVDVGAWLREPPGTAFSADPRIAVVKQFISEPVCKRLIDLGRPHLREADIYDSATGELVVATRRRNSAAALDTLRSDALLAFVRARIAALAQVPLSALEASQILHYAVGEEFRPHYDFLNVAHPALARNVAQHGQRALTLLIYLNDDYDGGETAFIVLGRGFKGRKGDALIFWNVTEEGALDWRTQHAGTAPTRGEKWLFSQWIRVRAAQPR